MARYGGGVIQQNGKVSGVPVPVAAGDTSSQKTAKGNPKTGTGVPSDPKAAAAAGMDQVKKNSRY